MLTLAALSMMATLSVESDANANATARPLMQQVAAEAQANDPIRLEDIEVVGRPLDNLIINFIDQVAAPARSRGLARWEAPVCVGVSNLKTETAQYMVDRIQTVGADLGLRTGQPGCRPNVIIVAASDANAATAALTRNRARFIMGGSGMDRGYSALRNFRNNDRPVRWWNISLPVDSETGARATRLPGDCENDCDVAWNYAPHVASSTASRLTTQVVDNMAQTVVVLDIDKVSNVSIQQLSDYVSMVVYAQINPDADTSAYASVLNVFDAPQTADGLTQWDLAYLEGLYAAQRNRGNRWSANREIADSIRRAHQRLSSAEE